MLKIAGGIVLAIIILLLVFRCLVRVTYWMQKKNETKVSKKRAKEERIKTEEWLKAVEVWDKYAKRWKEEYFKHKAFLELWSHSFFEKFKDKEKNDVWSKWETISKWFIIGFCIFCGLAIIIVVACLIAKLS